MLNNRRAVASAIVCVCLLAACPHDSRPTEAQAKTEFQRVLDGFNYGVWRVNAVRRTNGRMTARDGTRAYVMEAEIDVTVIKAIRREDFVARSLKMLIDVWNGKTWLLSMIGRSGDHRILSMQLLWIEKDKGWELVGPCNDCG